MFSFLWKGQTHKNIESVIQNKGFARWERKREKLATKTLKLTPESISKSIEHLRKIHAQRNDAQIMEKGAGRGAESVKQVINKNTKKLGNIWSG